MRSIIRWTVVRPLLDEKAASKHFWQQRGVLLLLDPTNPELEMRTSFVTLCSMSQLMC